MGNLFKTIFVDPVQILDVDINMASFDYAQAKECIVMDTNKRVALTFGVKKNMFNYMEK